MNFLNNIMSGLHVTHCELCMPCAYGGHVCVYVCVEWMSIILFSSFGFACAMPSYVMPCLRE